MYKSENIQRSSTNKNAWELQQNDVIGQKKLHENKTSVAMVYSIEHSYPLQLSSHVPRLWHQAKS